MIVTALLALAAAAQHAPAPPAASPNSDYHFRWLSNLAPAEGWRRTVSGLRYRKLSGPGTGPRPAVTDRVTIHYAGRFIDGTEFDSSVSRGEPATFPLSGLIRGWQEGVPLMGVGDRYEFAIPYNLAYGYAGRGPIPGGATLIFTIDLIAILPSRPPGG
jgi:FKBP-type peptidyl-prolyl cis-trans isomerase FkpA